MITDPELAWGRLALRLVWRSAAAVVVLTALMTGVVVATYNGVTADPAAAATLRALAANQAVRTLFGEPLALDTPGGFTVWRTGTIIALLVSGWAIFSVVRLTRGEEEAGRWSLPLGGVVPVRRATAAQVAIVAAAVAGAGLAIGLALVLTGTPAAGAAVHAAGIALTGMFFAAAAALSAQIFADRTAAIASAGAGAAAALLVRMVGDGWSAVSALRWFTPLGLTELSRPYAGDRWLPLLVLAAGVVALGAAAAIAAARRDVGDALVVTRPNRPPRRQLLGSVESFAVRRNLRPLAGWGGGIGAYFLIIGLVATSMLELLRSYPELAETAGQAGFGGLTTVQGYVGVLSGVLAVPVGVYSVLRLDVLRAMETRRTLTALAAQPVSRIRLLAAEGLAALAGAVVVTTVAGCLIWCGVTLTSAHLPIAETLAGAWNTLPIMLLSVGAAVLALGRWPRATIPVGLLPAVGGFLFLVIAKFLRAPAWLVGVSPYAHLAEVPLVPPDWPATVTMTLIAAALATAGAAGYRRRDLMV